MDTSADEEFDGFMRGRWPAMVRLAYALTGDAGHAEDLAQAAFARAYASWSRVRRAGDPDAYVRRIVINAHRSRFRRHRAAEELRGDLTDAGGERDLLHCHLHRRAAAQADPGYRRRPPLHRVGGTRVDDGHERRGRSRRPVRGNGQIKTAIPFSIPDHPPVFGPWQGPGLPAAPPRATVTIKSGTAAPAWSVTVYEGPWGTCAAQAAGEATCEPSGRITATEIAAFTSDGGTSYDASGKQAGTATMASTSISATRPASP